MSLVTVRTMPLRVAPVEGEALDSWLEATAARHEVVLGDILRWCEMTPRTSASWMYSVTKSERVRLAEATGQRLEVIEGMSPSQRGLHQSAGHLSLAEAQASPWGWRADSRFCPRCLRDSAGRWLLSWRLNWSFVCLTHRAMLVERCPRCCGFQRSRAHPAWCVPHPGHCSCRIRTDYAQRLDVCGFDLSQVPQREIPQAHQLLSTQEKIIGLLAGRSSRLRIYGRCEPPAAQVIRDLKCIVRWIVSGISTDAIDDAHLRDVVRQCSPAGQPPRVGGEGDVLAGTALGIVLAMGALDARSESESVARFVSLMLATRRGGFLRLNHSVRDLLTPAVRAVYDDAYRQAREQWAWRRRMVKTLEHGEPATSASPRWAR